MASELFLRLHFEGRTKEVLHVDPDIYSFVVLLSDMTEKFHDDPILWQKLNLKVICAVPGREDMVVVDGDKTLMEVFSLNVGQDWIDFFFTEKGKDGLDSAIVKVGVSKDKFGSADGSLISNPTVGKDAGVCKDNIGRGNGIFIGTSKDKADDAVGIGGAKSVLGKGVGKDKMGGNIGVARLGSGLVRLGSNKSGLLRLGSGLFEVGKSSKLPENVISVKDGVVSPFVGSEFAGLASMHIETRWGSGASTHSEALALNSFLQDTSFMKKPRKKKFNDIPKPSNLRRSQRFNNHGEGTSGVVAWEEEMDDNGDDDEISDDYNSDDELYVVSDENDSSLGDEDDSSLGDEVIERFIVPDEDGGSDGEFSQCNSADRGNDLDETDSEIDDDPMKGLLNRSSFTVPQGQKFRLEKGMIFENIEAYRKILYEYSIMWGFTVRKVKNERTRVTAVCADEGCNWRAHASLMPDDVTFCIKTCNPYHTCAVDPELQATARWLSYKIEDIVRADRDVKVQVMRDIVLRFGVHPSNLQLFRAKNLAIDRIDGNHAESYTLMPNYCRMIQMNNRRNVAKIEYCTPLGETVPYIKRVFIGYAAQKEGFMDGCVPFIGFDGCHLKGPYGGVLLSAVGLDGDNGLFPIANAVVEAENYDSWTFFLTLLGDLMDGFPSDREWTFMSDRQKGLTEALLNYMPNAKHRKCCHHIEANFKAKYSAVILRKLFWVAAKAYTKEEFNHAMQTIKKVHEPAYDWLEKIETETWARHAYSERLKCDHITNNISESFNSWIGRFRNKPVMTIFENIRRMVMSKIHKRYSKACTWTNEVTPKVIKALQRASQDCKHLTYWIAAAETYEVQDTERSYIVKLDKMHCDCRVWNHSGIPCKHAVVVLLGLRRKLVDYCDPMLSKAKYLQAYSHVMDPIPDQFFWPQMENPPCRPPILRRRVGRPSSTRRRAADESPSMKRSLIVKCGRCGAIGHNQRTCAGGPVNQRSRGTFRGRGRNSQTARPELHAQGNEGSNSSVRLTEQ